MEKESGICDNCQDKDRCVQFFMLGYPTKCQIFNPNPEVKIERKRSD
jgi:hypothetical protein